MTNREELYGQIREAVVAFEEERVKDLARKSLDEGCDPVETIVKGLSSGMLAAGNLFDKHEYFVPEMLMCADAMQAGLDILRPRIRKESAEHKGQVVIGTVQGDVHDIGKNIVKLMLEVSGFMVLDLGRDVDLNRFAEEAERTRLRDRGHVRPDDDHNDGHEEGNTDHPRAQSSRGDHARWSPSDAGDRAALRG